MACAKLNDARIQLINIQSQLNDTQLQLSNIQQECKENKRKLEEVSARESPSLLQISGVHTWKICGFMEKMKQAKSTEQTQIKSPPFYDHGYKFRLTLGLSRKTLSLPSFVTAYFFVMKGEYDALLSWPLPNKKVTITLIDQQEDPRQRENRVITFASPYSLFENFKRVENDGSKSLLDNFFMMPDDLHKRRYVVDDTVFIQIKIDPAQ